MENIDAKQARILANPLYEKELDNILSDIKHNAKRGDTVLHIYKPINIKTVEALRDKGFEVIKQPSISIHKDGLFYSIYWA